MGKLVVAKLYRLGKDGDKFTTKFKSILRERVIIDEDYIKSFNSSMDIRGQVYEVDQDATNERNEKLEPKSKQAEAAIEPAVKEKPKTHPDLK